MNQDWKTKPWVWGGADAEMLKRSTSAVHAIVIPGVGIFGGFPPEIAKHIVDCVNETQPASDRALGGL